MHKDTMSAEAPPTSPILLLCIFLRTILGQVAPKCIVLIMMICRQTEIKYHEKCYLFLFRKRHHIDKKRTHVGVLRQQRISLFNLLWKLRKAFCGGKE